MDALQRFCTHKLEVTRNMFASQRVKYIFTNTLDLFPKGRLKASIVSLPAPPHTAQWWCSIVMLPQLVSTNVILD